MYTNKTSSVATTITPTMQLVSKTNNQVISSSGTSMTAKQSQYIFFSLSDIIESGETISSYKLKFSQVGSSQEEMMLYKSDASRMIYDIGYKMMHTGNELASYREVDITDAVIDSNGETMYFAIVCNSSTGVGIYTGTATPATRRPKKIVNKVIDNDFVKNQQFLTGKTKDNDQYSINIRNGKFLYQMNLVSTYAEYMPTSLDICYNPSYFNQVFETGLPKGWKFNYFQKVTTSGSNYIYIDGSFKKHTFVLADNLSSTSTEKVYYEQEGNYLILKLNTSSTDEYFEISDENTSSLFFNSSGYLKKIVTKVSTTKQYTTTLTYNASNQLTKITDGSSCETNIAYNSTNKTITITKPNGKTVTLNYDSNQCMTSIVNTDGDSTSFDYTSTGLITRAVNPSLPISSEYILNKITSNNKQLSLTYLSDSKVVEKFKEEYVDSSNVTHIDKSYILKYSKLRTVVECHPFTNYLRNSKSTYFMYTFDENGEVIVVNETTSSQKILSSKLFKRTQAGTSSATNTSTPYMYLNQEVEVTSTTGPVTLSNVTFPIVPENDFATKQQFTLIVEYSLTFRNSLQNSTSSQLYVEVKDGTSILAKADLNQNNEFKQEMFLSYDSKVSNPTISFTNTNPDISLSVLAVSLFIGGYSNPKMFASTNFNGSNPSASTFFEFIPHSIQYEANATTNSISGIEMTYQDFVKNKENYYQNLKKNSLKYNVWYNDGQNMLYNVSLVKYVSTTDNKTINQLDIVNCNRSSIYNTGALITYDLTNEKRLLREYKEAKNYDNSVSYIIKEVDDYGFVLSETNEKGVTVVYTIEDGNVTSQKVRNENNSYVGVNNDNDLITKFTFTLNRLESAKSYYKTHTIGYKNTYDTIGNVLKTFDINDSSTPVTSKTYGSTSSELLDKIVFDKSSTDEVTSLTYDNKKVATLTHSNNPIYNFIYDYRNNIKEIKISGVSICTISYNYSTSEISKTITYATGEKERLTYNKYGKLIKLERADNVSSFSTVFETSYHSYNKENEEIEEANSNLKITESKNNTGVIEYAYNVLNADGSKFYYWNSSYNDNVSTQIKTGLINNTDLQQVIYTNEVETKINYYDENENEGYIKETNYVCQDQAHATNKSTKKIEFSNGTNVTAFEEELTEDPLGRCFNSSTSFGGIDYHKDYEFASATNGTSNFVSKETLSFTSSSGAVNKELSYEYDNKGNIISVIGEGTVTYEYDNNNRLIRENNTNFNTTYVYTYDIYGNITSKKKYAYTASGTTPSSLQLTTTYEYNNSNKTLLTNYNGTLVSYDAINQPTLLKGNSLTWKFGKLSSYGNTSYEYSIFGKRVKKTAGDKITYFIYDGDRLIREDRYDANDVHTRINYIYGSNGVIGFRYESNGTHTDYYYRKNMFGDVIGLYYNSGGYVITAALYYYDAWGNCKVTDANGTESTASTFIGNINPIRYRGYYYDVETQLYWVSSRYYSPELCRWISPDSIEYLDPESINGLNLYAYCGNDPINKCDPTGHFAVTLTTLLIGGLIAGAIGAGIGLGTAIYKDVKEDGVWFNGDWTDYVGRTLGGFVAGFGVGICTVLGAGVGAAALGGTTATLFTSSGLALSYGSALAIGSGVAFSTGMAGYAVRTGISRSEEFNVGNMFIEGGFNALSGALSVFGGYLGGSAGVHNTVFTKLLSKKGDFLLRLLIENGSTALFKISGALLKPHLMI